MSDLRKIVSLFVGLIVVLLIVSYTFGKLGFYAKNKTTDKSSGALSGIFGTKKATPTPTGVSKKITIKQIVSGDESKTQTITTETQNGTTTTNVAPQKTLTADPGLLTTKQVAVPNSIPSTGAGTVVLPLLLSGFVAGTYLRRKS